MIRDQLRWTSIVATLGFLGVSAVDAFADGACCWPDGSCSVVALPDDCWGQGGEYLGDGTDCTGQVCTGACCLADGSCMEDVPEDNCWGQ